MATGAIKYISNIGKSITYSSIDRVKKMNPVITEFAEDNSDLGKVLYESAKDFKGTMKKTGDYIAKSKVGEFAVEYKTALFEDLRSGKFYNKERVSRMQAEAAGGLLDFDTDDPFANIDSDDFDDDSSWLDSDIGDDDIFMANQMDNVGERTASAISQATGRAAEYVVASNKQGIMATQRHNEYLNNKINLGMAAVNSNIANIVQFNEKVNRVHIENSKLFFDTSTKLDRERNEILAKLLEAQTSMYKTTMTERKKGSQISYGDIVGAEGTPNLKMYGKKVMQNIDSSTGGIMGMTEMFEGGNMLKTFAGAPLQFITDALVKSMTPRTVEKAMEGLNQTLSGFFGSLMSKFGSMKSSDNSAFNLIGKVFGINTSLNSRLDTSKYERGAIPFDGTTKMAITQVIPMHLAKIESALTGQTERMFDYAKGAFASLESIKTEYEGMTDKYSANASADLRAEMQEMLKTVKMSYDDRESLESSMKAMFKEAYSDGKLVDLNRKDLSPYDMGMDEKSFITLKNLLNNIDGHLKMQYNSNVWSNRESQRQALASEQDDPTSIYRLLGNGFNINEYSNKDKNGKNLNPNDLGSEYGNKNPALQNNIVIAKDNKGHNLFHYMQRLTEDIEKIRYVALSDGIGSGTGGGADRPRGHGLYNPAVSGIDKAINFESANDIRNENRSSAKNAHNRENRRNYNRLKPRHKTSYNPDSKTITRNTTIDGYYFDDTGSYNELDFDKYSEMQNSHFKESKTYRQQQKARDVYKESQNTYGNKFKNKLLHSDSLGDGLKSFIIGMDDLTSKPLDTIAKMLNKVDERLYQVIYGNEDKDKLDPKSFMGSLTFRMKDTFADITNFVKDDLLLPLKDMIFGENFKESLKSMGNNMLGYLGIDVADIKERVAHNSKDFGKKAFSGPMAYAKNAMKDVYSPLFGYVKGKETSDFTGRRMQTNEDNRRSEERAQELAYGELANMTDEEFEERYRNSGVPGFAYGSRAIKRTGVAVLSEGEMVLPSHLNPFYTGDSNKGRQVRQESKVQDKFNKLMRRSGIGNGINAFASGNKNVDIDDDGMVKNRRTAMGSGENARRVEYDSQRIKYDESNYDDQPLVAKTVNVGRNSVNKVLSRLGFLGKKGKDKFREAKNLKSTDELFNEALADVTGDFSQYLPGTVAGSVIGGGLALITGAVGGPILGAAVGAGTNLILQSDKVRDWLFGEMSIDEDGNETRQGNILSAELSNNIHKYLPDMAKGATVGAITSILPFVPGGPVAGIIIGSSLGFAKNSDKMQSMLFGDIDKTTGDRKNNGLFKKEFLEKLKSAVPHMTLGGVASLLIGGPFGVAGNIAVGASIGYLSQTGKFQEALFGKYNEDTDEYEGGILGTIKSKFIDPIVSSVKPLAKQIELGVKSIFHGATGIFRKIFDDELRIPIKTFLQERVFKRATKAVTGVAKAITRPAIAVASLPFRAIGGVGNHFRRRQIADGNATYMTAEERVSYRDKYKEDYKDKIFRNPWGSGKLKRDKYAEFDQDLIDMDEDSLGSISSSLEFLKDPTREADNLRKSSEKKLKDTIIDDAGLEYGDYRKVLKHLRSGNSKGAFALLKRSGLSLENQQRINLDVSKNYADYQTSKEIISNTGDARDKMNAKLRKMGLKDIDSRDGVSKYQKLIDNELKERKDKTPEEWMNDQEDKRHKEIVSLFDDLIKTIKITADPNSAESNDLKSDLFNKNMKHSTKRKSFASMLDRGNSGLYGDYKHKYVNGVLWRYKKGIDIDGERIDPETMMPLDENGNIKYDSYGMEDGDFNEFTTERNATGYAGTALGKVGGAAKWLWNAQFGKMAANAGRDISSNIGIGGRYVGGRIADSGFGIGARKLGSDIGSQFGAKIKTPLAENKEKRDAIKQQKIQDKADWDQRNRELFGSKVYGDEDENNPDITYREDLFGNPVKWIKLKPSGRWVKDTGDNENKQFEEDTEPMKTGFGKITESLSTLGSKLLGEKTKDEDGKTKREGGWIKKLLGFAFSPFKIVFGGIFKAVSGIGKLLGKLFKINPEDGTIKKGAKVALGAFGILTTASFINSMDGWWKNTVAPVVRTFWEDKVYPRIEKYIEPIKPTLARAAVGIDKALGAIPTAIDRLGTRIKTFLTEDFPIMWKDDILPWYKGGVDLIANSIGKIAEGATYLLIKAVPEIVKGIYRGLREIGKSDIYTLFGGYGRPKVIDPRDPNRTIDSPINEKENIPTKEKYKSTAAQGLYQKMFKSSAQDTIDNYDNRNVSDSELESYYNMETDEYPREEKKGFFSRFSKDSRNEKSDKKVQDTLNMVSGVTGVDLGGGGYNQDSPYYYEDEDPIYDQDLNQIYTDNNEDFIKEYSKNASSDNYDGYPDTSGAYTPEMAARDFSSGGGGYDGTWNQDQMIEVLSSLEESEITGLDPNGNYRHDLNTDVFFQDNGNGTSTNLDTGEEVKTADLNNSRPVRLDERIEIRYLKAVGRAAATGKSGIYSKLAKLSVKGWKPTTIVGKISKFLTNVGLTGAKGIDKASKLFNGVGKKPIKDVANKAASKAAKTAAEAATEAAKAAAKTAAEAAAEAAKNAATSGADDMVTNMMKRATKDATKAATGGADDMVANMMKRVTKDATKAATSGADDVIAEAVKRVVQDASNVDDLIEAGGKHSGIIADFFKRTTKAIKGFATNKKAKKAMKAALKENGDDFGESAVNIGMDILTKETDNIVNSTMGPIIKESGEKFASAFKSVMPFIDIAFMIGDFVHGYNNASSYMGILDEDTTAIQRLICGTANLITGKFLLGIPSMHTIMGLVTTIADFIFPGYAEKMNSFREKAEEVVGNHNFINKTEYTVEDYNKRGNLKNRITGKWKKTKDDEDYAAVKYLYDQDKEKAAQKKPLLSNVDRYIETNNKIYSDASIESLMKRHNVVFDETGSVGSGRGSGIIPIPYTAKGNGAINLSPISRNTSRSSASGSRLPVHTTRTSSGHAGRSNKVTQAVNGTSRISNYSAAGSGLSIPKTHSARGSMKYSKFKAKGSINSGENIIEQIAYIIGMNESNLNYACINPNDSGSLSVGKYQFNGGWDNDNAQPLMRKICKANPTKSKEILGDELYTKFTTQSLIGFVPNTSQIEIIKRILSTDYGMKAQDEFMIEQIKAHITRGIKAGVEDPKAMIYYTDLAHQHGGGNADKIVRYTLKEYPDASLDAIYSCTAAAHENAGKYPSRRNATYNFAKSSGVTTISKNSYNLSSIQQGYGYDGNGSGDATEGNWFDKLWTSISNLGKAWFGTVEKPEETFNYDNVDENGFPLPGGEEPGFDSTGDTIQKRRPGRPRINLEPPGKASYYNSKYTTSPFTTIPYGLKGTLALKHDLENLGKANEIMNGPDSTKYHSDIRLEAGGILLKNDLMNEYNVRDDKGLANALKWRSGLPVNKLQSDEDLINTWVKNPLNAFNNTSPIPESMVVSGKDRFNQLNEMYPEFSKDVENNLGKRVYAGYRPNAGARVDISVSDVQKRTIRDADYRKAYDEYVKLWKTHSKYVDNIMTEASAKRYLYEQNPSNIKLKDAYNVAKNAAEIAYRQQGINSSNGLAKAFHNNYLKYEESMKHKKNSISSGSIGIHTSVTRSARGSGFISQLDPAYAYDRLGNDTVAQSGCGPAAAAMAISGLSARGSEADLMNQTTALASRYNDSGGTNAAYFEDVFSRAGADTAYHDGSNRKAMIENSLMGGEQVVLMGRDSNNTTKDRSPFGPNNHYVLAKGLSGNKILINDPELSGPRIYDKSILNNTELGVSVSARGSSIEDKGVWNSINDALSKLSYAFNGTVIGGQEIGDAGPDTMSSILSDGTGNSVQVISKMSLASLLTYARSFKDKIKYSQDRRYDIDKGGNYADCSSYTWHIFKKFGVKIGTYTGAQVNDGIEVSFKDLQPGDLVMFKNTASGSNTYNYNRGVSHVGIYTGDDMFIHCSSGSNNVVEVSLSNSSLYKKNWLCGRRVIQPVSGDPLRGEVRKLSTNTKPSDIKRYAKGSKIPNKGTPLKDMVIQSGKGSKPITIDNNISSYDKQAVAGNSTVISDPNFVTNKLLQTVVKLLGQMVNDTGNIKEVVALLTKVVEKAERETTSAGSSKVGASKPKKSNRPPALSRSASDVLSEYSKADNIDMNGLINDLTLILRD